MATGAGAADDRLLVIGASGQVGRALCTEFAAYGTIVAAGNRHVEPGQRVLNLADGAAVQGILQDVNPALVLLAGGMTNVDGCELEPETCHQINVAGTEVIAEHARATGAVVVFFSTDHVFDGTRESFSETDAVAPLNVYARSKVRAEDVLRTTLPDDHLILRTSWVYGSDQYRRNFVLRLIDQLGQGKPLTVPDDQWGSPTHAGDLARAARTLVEQGARGTFHATGPDFISRTCLAGRVCDAFALNRSLIVARPTSALGQAAPRPLKVRLDCGKLARAGVEPFRTIDSGLQDLKAWLGVSPS